MRYLKKIKTIIAILTSIMISFVIPISANGNPQNTEEIPTELRQLYAQGICLMDAESGRVLYGKNETKPLPMASTTKIMTLLVALEEGELTDEVTISAYAASMPKVRLGVRKGETYILEDLLYSLMLESHNDVSVAIAEHIALKKTGETDSEKAVLEFAKLMNKKAEEIGCKDTYYITPNGLDASINMVDKTGESVTKTHQTTPQELAKIMSYAVKHSPVKEKFLEITQTPKHTFSNTDNSRLFACYNHNAFLNMMDGAISGKTGFTGNAGYCYVGALERDGKTFVVSLLACGWPNNKTYKWSDTKALMNYGIDNYKYHTFDEVLVDEDKMIPIEVKNGQTKQIGETAYTKMLVLDEKSQEEEAKKEGLLLLETEKIEIKYEIKDTLIAPVKKGSKIGEIIYEVDGEIWLKKPVVITENIEAIDYKWCLKQVIDRLFSL